MTHADSPESVDPSGDPVAQEGHDQYPSDMSTMDPRLAFLFGFARGWVKQSAGGNINGKAYKLALQLLIAGGGESDLLKDVAAQFGLPVQRLREKFQRLVRALKEDQAENPTPEFALRSDHGDDNEEEGGKESSEEEREQGTEEGAR